MWKRSLRAAARGVRNVTGRPASRGAAVLGTVLLVSACSDTTPDRAFTAVELGEPVQAASPVATAPVSPAWQSLARSFVASNGQSPLAAGRTYAALSVAQYQAVVQAASADQDGTLAEHGVGMGGRSARELERGAVAGASYEVLMFLYSKPANQQSVQALLESQTGATPGQVHPQFTRGLAIGKAVGAAMVNRLKTDKSAEPWNGDIATGPDKWEKAPTGTPAGITLSQMKPWLLTKADQFQAPEPPKFGTPEFMQAALEIKGIEMKRNAEQIAIANYWNFPGGTYTPIGYWDEKAASYIATYALDERAATRAFALTTVAMMDALIGCWESKYYWLVRRPSQVIGMTLVFGLPNHPSYPSGHSCSSAAAATVLSQLFPDRAAELATYVYEAGQSRKYAGIHYQFDITAGENLGNSVGQYTLQRDAAVGLLGAIH